MDLPSALPSGLAELPATRVLIRALQEDRVPHAILLFGPSLTSLEKLGFELAGALLHSGTFRPENPMEHPDLFLLRPQNKMRQISADQVRRLIGKVQQTPHSADRKVVVVSEADRLNLSASNIFLKTLEEPPRDTILILLTTRFYSLLDTIRSRCMSFHISLDDEQKLPPEWNAWIDDYGQWVNSLADRNSRPAFRTQPLFALYDLIPRFEQILQLAQSELQETTDADGLSPEELDARHAGVQRGVRLRMLSELQSATLKLVRQYPDRQRILAGERAISQLEKARFLLDVNLPTAPSLEAFFLSSLRIWASTL